MLTCAWGIRLPVSTLQETKVPLKERRAFPSAGHISPHQGAALDLPRIIPEGVLQGWACLPGAHSLQQWALSTMPTHGCWCQFNTNRNPQPGMLCRQKFYPVQNSSIVIQYLGPGGPGARFHPAQQFYSAPQWSALCCAGVLRGALVCSGLCWSAPPRQDIFGVSAQPERVFHGKEKGTLRTTGELANIDRSPSPWSLIGPSSCR